MFPCWDCLGNDGWVYLLMVVVFVGCFVALAIVCDEHMIKALETLCVRWNVREDVAGATFMAFGSAAPEIIINAISTLKSQVTTDSDSTELGLGAIMGSGLIAFLAIPGLCGLFANEDLELKRRPLLRDVLFYLLSLVSVVIAFSDGKITPYEGLGLVLIYVVYILVVTFASNARALYREHINRPLRKKKSFVEEQRDTNETRWLLEARLTTAQQTGTTLEPDTTSKVFSAVSMVGNILCAPLRFLFYITCPACGDGERFESLYALTFFISLCWVAVFSYIISSIVESWGNRSNVPLSFFGMALVSIGAEIPDLIQSVAVSRRGYGSMAVSNCIGSQITNLCVGLGLPWFLASVSKDDVRLPGHEAVEKMVYFVVGGVLLNVALLLGIQVVKGERKAYLTKGKSQILVFAYIGVVVAYSCVVFV